MENLLIQINRRLSRDIPRCAKPLGARRVEQIVSRIKNYIEGNYTDHLTVESVAHHVALSPNYLSTLFKRATGCTVKHFICEVRIREARRLLSDTTKRVSEIAYAVGYSSPFYFSRLFKSATGTSPSEYRHPPGRTSVR